MESLLRSLGAIEATGLLEEFVSHALADDTHYGLHEILIPVAQQLHAEIGHDPAVRACYRWLLDHCIEALHSLTATPPPAPTDWAQDVTIDCTCADCRELVQFLRDPHERVHRFRVRKERRQHLHRQIDGHHCDVDHVTERQGSPQTLVCTKNRTSYERKRQQFVDNTRWLAELRRLAASPPRLAELAAQPAGQSALPVDEDDEEQLPTARRCVRMCK